MRIPDGDTPLGREFIDLGADVVAALLLTISRGWRRACDFSDVNAGAGEVHMTERLRDGMRNDLKLRKNSWSKTLVILPGTESRSTTETTNPDGRTDIPLMLIRVFLRTQEHDPHAIIECKRIAGSNVHLCREYVVEGIDRFRLEKYGENHATGFMVGYVLSGTAHDSAKGVNAYLERVSRDEDQLTPTHIYHEASTWKSQHFRERRRSSICLHHSFLDCTRAAAEN